MYKAVIHLPTKQEDVEKLMQEFARFRVDKTVKLLREQGVTAAELKKLLCDICTEQAIIENGSRPWLPF